MEKDVLIEMTMATIAKIRRAVREKITTEEESQSDNRWLWNLRTRLYGSREYEWDYNGTLAQIKEIGNKYKGEL